MLIVSFDVKVVMHWEFVPLQQTINPDFCYYVFKALVIRNSNCVSQQCFCTQNLHNMRALAPNSMNTPHPTYSPELIPLTLFMFPKIKTEANKGRHFNTVEQIQNGLPQLETKMSREHLGHGRSDRITAPMQGFYFILGL